MRFSHHLLLVTLFALSACSSTTSKIKQNLTFFGVNYQAYSQISETSFRGLFYYDDEQAYFKSCDSDIEYEITNNNDLYDIYETITDDQDEEDPVYIEFSGEIIFPEHNNSNSPINIRADRVHHMAVAKASLQCAKATDTFDFKAKGNEPYWRINVHDNQLFFATKASNESYQLDGINLNTTTLNHLKGINDKGEELLIKILPEHCYMHDNKEYWSFSTQINSIYGEFIGCGESGHLNNVDLFKGEYSNQTQNINLTLNQDHTFKYLQIHDKQQNLKTGFWKSNTQNNVVLMFTSENKQTTQEELILTYNGSTLFANQINKDNVVTEFEQTLVFEKKDPQQNQSEDSQTVQIKRQFTAQLIVPEKNIDLEVKAALNKYFRIHQTDPKNTQFSSVRFDLNGDGFDEAIVLLDWCSSQQCEMLIFEANKNGLTFSSRVSRTQAPIIVAKDLHFSWQSLITKNEDSWLLLDFDGLSYPLHTRYGYYLQNIENSTEVTLFPRGKPTQWFLIK